MPEAFISMSVGLEQTIATNGLARVTTDVADLPGTPATTFDAFVRNALLNV